MQMIQECDGRRFSHLIRHMARQFTTQLQGSLSKDNKLQNMHGSGTILCDGVFEQHLRLMQDICSSSLCVQS